VVVRVRNGVENKTPTNFFFTSDVLDNETLGKMGFGTDEKTYSPPESVGRPWEYYPSVTAVIDVNRDPFVFGEGVPPRVISSGRVCYYSIMLAIAPIKRELCPSAPATRRPSVSSGSITLPVKRLIGVIRFVRALRFLRTARFVVFAISVRLGVLNVYWRRVIIPRQVAEDRLIDDSFRTVAIRRYPAVPVVKNRRPVVRAARSSPSRNKCTDFRSISRVTRPL